MFIGFTGFTGFKGFIGFVGLRAFRVGSGHLVRGFWEAQSSNFGCYYSHMIGVVPIAES